VFGVDCGHPAEERSEIRPGRGQGQGSGAKNPGRFDGPVDRRFVRFRFRRDGRLLLAAGTHAEHSEYGTGEQHGTAGESGDPRSSRAHRPPRHREILSRYRSALASGRLIPSS
jgi:hypothetical protein